MSGPREQMAAAADRELPLCGGGGFRGSLGLLVMEEGWAGRPYQPTSGSGVTLDPGIDLSAQTVFSLERIGEGVFTALQLDALTKCLGLREVSASNALKALPPLTWTPEQAGGMIARLFPMYWRQAEILVPGISSAPTAVQTGVASLIWNRGLGVLSLSMRAALLGDWPWLLWQWEQMASNPARRRREAAYIRKGLGSE